MRSRRAVKVCLLLAALWALPAACGRTTTVGRARSIQVTLSEYRLAPQKLHATAGPLTIVAHNFGRLVHNLAITQGGRLQAETAPIRPGGSVILSLYLPAGGYVLASNLLDDQSLGIYGTLTVSS